MLFLCMFVALTDGMQYTSRGVFSGALRYSREMLSLLHQVHLQRSRSSMPYRSDM